MFFSAEIAERTKENSASDKALHLVRFLDNPRNGIPKLRSGF